MDRRTTLGAALLVVAVVCLALPPLVPVQTVLMHDTTPITFDSPDQLESEGYEIYAYENLSDRGQELYVTTLENGGEYHVSPGEGAPDFEYLSPAERAEARQESRRRPGYFVIERPEDADLPPADEPDHGPRNPERRDQTQRYDMMAATAGTPPLDATSQLFRLAAVLLGILSAGVGGYLVSSKSSADG